MEINFEDKEDEEVQAKGSYFYVRSSPAVDKAASRSIVIDY